MRPEMLRVRRHHYLNEIIWNAQKELLRRGQTNRIYMYGRILTCKPPASSTNQSKEHTCIMESNLQIRYSAFSCVTACVLLHVRTS